MHVKHFHVHVGDQLKREIKHQVSSCFSRCQNAPWQTFVTSLNSAEGMTYLSLFVTDWFGDCFKHSPFHFAILVFDRRVLLEPEVTQEGETKD